MVVVVDDATALEKTIVQFNRRGSKNVHVVNMSYFR